MNFLLISVAVFLAGIAVWLWRLSKAQITGLSMEASLAPAQKVTATPLLKPSTLSMRYKKAVAIITKILRFVILVGLIVGTGYFFSLMIKKYTWVSLIIILILILSVLASFLLKYTILMKEKRIDKKLEKVDIDESKKFKSKIKTIGEMAMGDMVIRDSWSSYRHIFEKIIEYTGEATLPKKVYVGDSHCISINLKPTFSILYCEEPLRIHDSKSGKVIVLQIQRNSSLEQFLEIQLLAAGLVIDGDKMQRQSLTLPALSYYWNCYFPNSGDHKISLIIRVVSQSNSIELGTIQHNIKVAQLDHLTHRQAQLAGIVTGVLAVAVSLQQLDVLQKIASYISPLT